MKTLILYYTYGGATRACATQLAETLGAEVVEVCETRRPSMLGAFLRCPAAIRGRPSKRVPPITADFSAYERIVVMGPIWAGHPAPAVNSIIEALPKGTAVELYLVSSGGESAKDRVVAKVEGRGCRVAEYHDIKAGEIGR